jgi:phosphoserine aminotransferase
VVVVNKNILGNVNRKIPRMLDYRVHIKGESMINTPAAFSVYVSYLTLQWIKKQGLQAIEERNNRKAQKLYAAIDASSLFKGTVAHEDRSLMNVCFNIPSTTLPAEGGASTNMLEDKFIAFAANYGIVGIKGYRTVGGFRASIYNAMPESGVDTLIETMQEFEKSQV